MCTVKLVYSCFSLKWRRVATLMSEVWLGYVFWSMWLYWIFQEYVFALLVTGVSATMIGLLAFLLFPPLFLAIPVRCGWVWVRVARARLDRCRRWCNCLYRHGGCGGEEGSWGGEEGGTTQSDA